MRIRTGVALSLLLLAACSSGGGDDGGDPTASASGPATTAQTGPTAPASPTGGSETFDVTVNGLSIEGRCTGQDTGDPTAVLLHGNGGDQNGLAGLESYLAGLTRVCTYNRPGAGTSDTPEDLPRPVTEVVAEIDEVLEAAGIDPPYFVVGFSTGGELAFMFAQAHPQDVVGFVAINPGPPPFTAHIAAAREVLSKEELQTIELPDFHGNNPEQISHTDNDSILTDPLPATMPYHILFDEDCGGDTEFCDKILRFLPDIQRSLAEIGEGGRFTWVKGAGHDIDLTRPEVVEEAIDEIWELATG